MGNKSLWLLISDGAKFKIPFKINPTFTTKIRSLALHTAMIFMSEIGYIVGSFNFVNVNAIMLNSGFCDHETKRKEQEQEDSFSLKQKMFDLL